VLTGLDGAKGVLGAARFLTFDADGVDAGVFQDVFGRVEELKALVGRVGLGALAQWWVGFADADELDVWTGEEGAELAGGVGVAGAVERDVQLVHGGARYTWRRA